MKDATINVSIIYLCFCSFKLRIWFLIHDRYVYTEAVFTNVEMQEVWGVRDHNLIELMVSWYWSSYETKIKREVCLPRSKKRSHQILFSLVVTSITKSYKAHQISQLTYNFNLLNLKHKCVTYCYSNFLTNFPNLCIIFKKLKIYVYCDI